MASSCHVENQTMTCYRRKKSKTKQKKHEYINISPPYAIHYSLYISYSTSITTFSVTRHIKPSRRCFITFAQLFKWVFVASYFRGWNSHRGFIAPFVLENRWRFCIGSAKPSSNYHHILGCRSDSMDAPSTNLQPHENSVGELTKCRETSTRIYWLSFPRGGMSYIFMPSAIRTHLN